MLQLATNYFLLIPGDGLTEAWAMYNSLGGSNKEEGFNAVYAYIADNPYAQTWMRQDASLLIVFVSDEDEQSVNRYPTTSTFINWISSQRSDFHITSIVHYPSIFHNAIITQLPLVIVILRRLI